MDKVSTSTFLIPFEPDTTFFSRVFSEGRSTYTCSSRSSSSEPASSCTAFNLSKESDETIRYKHLTKGLWCLFSIVLPKKTLPFLQLFEINFLHVLLLHCNIPWLLQNSFVMSEGSKKADIYQPHIRVTDTFHGLLWASCFPAPGLHSKLLNSNQLQKLPVPTGAQKLHKHDVKYIICNHVNLYSQRVDFYLLGRRIHRLATLQSF